MITVTGRQLRAARALIGWEQIELSKKARVAIGTVRRMESFDGPIGSRTETLRKVIQAMEKVGVEFLNSGEPGVKVRNIQKKA